MPAQSQQQQKLFGLALSVKRGDTPRSEASEEVLKIVDSMTEKEIEDFAGTEHEGLPKKVEQKIREMARQTIRERMIGEAKFRRGDMVRVVDNPKYVMDKKKFAGMSGYVKNIIGRDIQVTFPNGRTIMVAPRDLEMNPNESVNEDKFYNTRVQYTDPKSKKKFVGDVVRKDGDEYKVNLGKDGRFEKYILAKAKDLKIVSKSKKRTFESVNEVSGEFVVYVEKNNGRKKLLHTKKSQRAANMFMSKNADKILNKSGIRSIGTMSKDQWEKDEAQFAENIKKSDMKTVTKKEWDRTHKDYKGMIKGQPYMMYLDKKTNVTKYGPVHIKESVNENKNVGHYERVGNQTIVDSNFINYSKGVLPNSELVHLGMGDFTLKTPKGDITFERSGKLVGIGQDFVGRHHRMTDNKGGKLVDELIKNMVKKKRAILSMSESLDEAKMSVVHKVAKKGSYPISLVVVKNGKVIDQELVNTPEAVPAAFNVIQSKHKGATVHIEDKTGKRLFSEDINETKDLVKLIETLAKKHKG